MHEILLSSVSCFQVLHRKCLSLLFACLPLKHNVHTSVHSDWYLHLSCLVCFEFSYRDILNISQKEDVCYESK